MFRKVPIPALRQSEFRRKEPRPKLDLLLLGISNSTWDLVDSAKGAGESLRLNVHNSGDPGLLGRVAKLKRRRYKFVRDVELSGPELPIAGEYEY